MGNVFDYVDSISKIRRVSTTCVFSNKDERDVLFSVMIPTYKRISTLGDAVESAINQYGFTDYEIIVVDNNPIRGDETERFMEKYRNVPKVSYYKNDMNIGMAGNFNKCLLLSSSNNMVLLHDDDVMSPYCLRSMQKLTTFLDEDWAILKPFNQPFSNLNELNFVEPNKIKLRRLYTACFYDGCPVGAPTVVLLNRDRIIAEGGYDQDYFPSYDYLMACKLHLSSSVYSAITMIPFGGYRVGINESTKETTMDAYVEKRYMISRALMKSKGIPSSFVKLLHTINQNEVVEIAHSYHILNYHIKNEREYYNLPPKICAALASIYYNFLKIPNFVNTKYLYIKNIK